MPPGRTRTPRCDHPDGGVLVERLVRIGPAGTPPVAEFAPQGLVGPFNTTVQSAKSWMGDSLTIRHRLPRLWERVVAGEVHHWKARQIAALTADLSVATAGEVDEQTSGWVCQLPWTSFLKTLDATILQVDEQAYRQREKLAAAKREVRATQSEEGLRTLIARGEAGDVALMLALYQRVAECLAEDGDEDPLPVRMSKAIGIIAQPARLTDLLGRHADDPDPHQQPWEQVAAHQADETDPWADDLPPAGWETSAHSNFYQPSFEDDEWWDQPRHDQPHDTEAEDRDGSVDPPIDGEDLAWYLRGGGTPALMIRSSPTTPSQRRPVIITLTITDQPMFRDRPMITSQLIAPSTERAPTVRITPPILPLVPRQQPLAAAALVLVQSSSGGRLRSGHPAGSPSPRPSSPPAHPR